MNMLLFLFLSLLLLLSFDPLLLLFNNDYKYIDKGLKVGC